MNSIINQFGILFLLIALFTIDGLFKLVPIFSLIAEGYSYYLDITKKNKVGKEPILKNQKLTWQELQKHDNQSSAYVAIKGKVYDVTSFLEKHPGGKEFLLLNCGRDATLAFQSYHPFSDKPTQLLEKYLIGELITTEWPTFKPDSGFYKECSEKVKKYFESKNINPKTPIPGLIRAIPLWICFAYTFYIVFLDPTTSFKIRILIGILFGIIQSLNTLHLMHDASHGAVGNNERWWWFFGRFTLDYISGSSMLAWQNQHVVGHHQYTNIMGSDPDVPQTIEGDVRRILKEQVWSKLYLYQHIYMPILYGLLSLRSRYYDVFEIFLHETDGPVKVNPISRQDKIRQASSKLLWLFWRCYLPSQLSGLTLIQFWFLFIFVEFITGYWLAINFQVSHVSDEAEFFYNNMDKVTKTGSNEQWPIEWAILQIKTSVDYSHGNWLMTYFCGALNYQVVHHLFPGVSQYLYPQIAPIILDVCKKHDLKYNKLPGFKEAWNGHFNHLKNMGKQQKFVGFAKME